MVLPGGGAAPDEGAAGKASGSPSEAAVGLMTEGQRLIYDNSEDSVAASVDDLEKGIARVREALRSGHPDEAKGQKLLAEAYHSLVNNTNAPAERKAEYERAELQAYRTLMKLEPRSPEWAERCASMETDPERKLQAWRSMVASFPDRAGPRLTLGKLLCERKDPAAVEQFFAAARALPEGDPDGIGPEIMHAIVGCGSEGQALELRTIVEPKLETTAPPQ